MQCTKPVRIQIKTKTGYSSYRYPNGLEVPCGKCTACRIKKRSEWSLRMQHELTAHKDSVFVTLTYSDDHIPENYSLKKRDLQLFIKRLRKAISPKKIRYFACGEYGEEKDRPHYHLIIFGLSLKKEDQQIINVNWTYGITHYGLAEPDSIAYVAGYIDKKLSGDKADEEYTKKNREAVFRLLSMGLGSQYADTNSKKITDSDFLTIRGKKHSIPRYYIKRLNIDSNKLKSHSEEKQIQTIKKITGLDLTYDEAYNQLSVEMNNSVIKQIKDSRHQHNQDLDKKISLKTKKL